MAFDEYGLTIKQRLFCMHYIANNGNGTQAAIKAGYSKTMAQQMATENLLKPVVRKYIGSKMKEAAIKLGIDEEYILNSLKENVQDCKSGKASKDGIVNAAGVVNSISEINKLLGYHAPEKKETEVMLPDIKELIEQERKDH